MNYDNGRRSSNNRTGAHKGLLEPDAVIVARPVLRGPGPSNGLGLPDKTTGWFPKVHIDTAKVCAVGQAGRVLLTEPSAQPGRTRDCLRCCGRGANLRRCMTRAKIIMDLALSLVLRW